VTKKLADFVLEAAEDGVILHKDAEKLIHPMYEHLKTNEYLLRDTYAGIHRKKLQSEFCDNRRRTEILRDKSETALIEQTGADLKQEKQCSEDSSMADEEDIIIEDLMGADTTHLGMHATRIPPPAFDKIAGA
jgi:hypothetical protein